MYRSLLGMIGALLGPACAAHADDADGAGGAGGSDGASSSAAGRANEPLEFLGRYDVVSRLPWDDDADHHEAELVAEGEGLAYASCFDQQCQPEAWLCQNQTSVPPEEMAEGMVRLAYTFEGDDGLGRVEVALAPDGPGGLRGTLTVSPCSDGSASCVADSLWCRSSDGYLPDCQGDDWEGLRNCTCVMMDRCP